MTTINSNISALVANNAIKQNDRAMSSAIEKLATGSRISSARDDAAGLSISARMATQISGLQMAARNVNDAISLVQTADGASKEITNMLGRMRELAVRAASISGNYTAEATAMDIEFHALLDQIDRIAVETEWNGNAILEGNGRDGSSALAKSVDVQLGANASQVMNLSLKTWRPRVAEDKEMDGADNRFNDRDGVDSVDKFRLEMASHSAYESITIAGLTITSAHTGIIGATGMSGHDVAKVLANLNEGDAGDASRSANVASVTGVLTGFTTGDQMTVNGDINPPFGGNYIVFTAVTPGTELAWSRPSYEYIIHGSQDGTPNNSAFGGGVFYSGKYDYLPPYVDRTNSSETLRDGAPGNVAPYDQAELNWGARRIRINYPGAARQAISELGLAIEGAAAERGKYGAYLNRLRHAADNLVNISMNTSASLSRVADTDYALETTKLARAQIISQASTAMLAQANQSKQTVLALLH